MASVVISPALAETERRRKFVGGETDGEEIKVGLSKSNVCFCNGVEGAEQVGGKFLELESNFDALFKLVLRLEWDVVV